MTPLFLCYPDRAPQVLPAHTTIALTVDEGNISLTKYR